MIHIGVIMMVVSMTGYGIDTFHVENTSVTVEIRTVNSRFLDFIPKIPRMLHELELDFKKVIQSYFQRGRIELYISIEGELLEQKKLRVNWDLLDQFMDNLQEIKKRYQLNGDIPLSVFTSVEDMFTIEEEQDSSHTLHDLLVESVQKVAGDVLRARKSEGKFLADDILTRIDSLEKLLKVITERKETVFHAYYERIQERMEQFIGNKIDVEERAILQEIALLAEKGDITEELTRLQSHFHHFREVMKRDEPIGRKLDFITQEMHRETNTIGAKSVDATISELVVTMKSEIEKIKEQVQNIE